MVEGLAPSGLETVNVSVRHWVAEDWETAPLETGVRATPKLVLTSLAVEVDGPVIWKVLKSRRS